jgi:hypothetical protein
MSLVQESKSNSPSNVGNANFLRELRYFGETEGVADNEMLTRPW